MSREGREVQIEAITGEQRQTIMGQKPLQGVDEHMRRMLCAGTQMEHGKKLCARVDDKPEPQHLFGATEAGAQFVQLEVREVEMAEEALMQGVRVLASAREPGGDGG